MSPHDVGNIQADGDLCAVICEETDVTDGEILKVIDTSSGTPELIVLTECPVATAEQVQQVAVNGATRQVVVSAGNNLYLFDVDSPGDLPLLMTAHADGIGDTQMAFDGESILYYTDAATPSAVVFDLGANDNALFAANPAAGTLAHRGGAFGYFLNDDSIGNHLRSSIGQLGDATAATATATNATIDDFIDGATTNNGAIGHGQTISILPDGSQWFIAGLESIGSGEYLQTSTGGAFTTVADPSGTDELGCPASDVNCSRQHRRLQIRYRHNDFCRIHPNELTMVVVAHPPSAVSPRMDAAGLGCQRLLATS
ncbi:MAG: hypothetical protein IPK83_16750 [Planctomycetes bacterium]|nr:hypothetical protein [Planctomycetota bacterium]